MMPPLINSRTTYESPLRQTKAPSKGDLQPFKPRRRGSLDPESSSSSFSSSSSCRSSCDSEPPSLLSKSHHTIMVLPTNPLLSKNNRLPTTTTKLSSGFASELLNYLDVPKHATAMKKSESATRPDYKMPLNNKQPALMACSKESPEGAMMMRIKSSSSSTKRKMMKAATTTATSSNSSGTIKKTQSCPSNLSSIGLVASRTQQRSFSGGRSNSSTSTKKHHQQRGGRPSRRRASLPTPLETIDEFRSTCFATSSGSRPARKDVRSTRSFGSIT